MHLRVVNHDIQSQSLHRESANGGEQRVRSDDAIMLRGHQSHARIHQFLLRIEDVERCTLPDSRLFAYAIERNFGAIHLRRGGFDLRFGGVQLAPALHDGSTRLIAIDVKIETLLAKRFLGLANGRIFGAALVDRNCELSQNGDVGRPKFLRIVW